MRSVTQSDIARKVGVSQAAVSMALNGADSPLLAARTVKRIVLTARRMGYAPNRFAQALRTRRTWTLACLVPDFANPFYPALLKGAQQVAEQAGYDVLAINTGGTSRRERHLVAWARHGRVDGVIGVFFHLRVPDFKPLLDAGVPVTRIEGARKAGGRLAVDDIFVDNRTAARKLTEYMLARGHRDVAMVAGRGGPQGARADGYRDAIAAAGLVPRVAVDREYSEAGGMRAARRLLARGRLPSAVFAANDLMAIGVMQQLRDAGIGIPQQVAVAGFDDIPAARLVSPALTTVSHFQDQVGARAASALIERLERHPRGPGRALEMKFKIIERAST